MGETNVNNGKRRFLVIATSVAGGAAAVAVAAPFVASMFPSARAKAAGAPVEVDISKVEPGMMIRAEWRSKPVWIVHRTPDMVDGLKKVDERVADPESNRPYAAPLREERVSLDQTGVACTRWRSARTLGCSPSDKLKAGPDSGLGDEWPGGFFCPCHGSKFDLAGRVFKDVPAPTNLEVPKYQFLYGHAPGDW